MTTLAGWGWRDGAAPYIRDNYFAATLATRSDYAIHDLLRCLLDGRLWRFFGQAKFYGSVDGLLYQWGLLIAYLLRAHRQPRA